MDYHYSLDASVAETLLHLPARQRRVFIEAFRMLADNPNLEGDTTFLDPSGRTIQKVNLGRWRISCWTDHPIKEVRIVGIQKI